MNNLLNKIKFEKKYKINENNGEYKNIDKNEISCVYNKQKKQIDLLYDYHLDMKEMDDDTKKLYIEGMNNINRNNIDLYINDKKLDFNYQYESNEEGEIKIKFKFKKLLTSTNFMFLRCSSLVSIDLSSFNATEVKNMRGMFYQCFSLKSIDLTFFNTTKVKNMSRIFRDCSSLKSLDLSSFNTINVNNMSYMFCGCTSLEYIDLSSFDTTNVNNIYNIFTGCYSLKKENVKINHSDNKILDELKKIDI